jgi:hypothetical protein
MPSPRVMPNMVNLPDGTILIVNGAKHGVAGFGLAEDPNFTALLYTPTDPKGSRISILGTTNIARLYHSEAALMPDGRVLISGNDPQTYWPNGTDRFPPEHRLEVYIPPYLNEGKRQPTVSVADNDWTNGGSYDIVVQLFQGNTGGMKVSLIGSASSTHGNTMGTRTIFPAFTCPSNTLTSATCKVTSPPKGVAPPGWYMLFVLDGPTPSYSQFIRIGGDPSRLGEWPALPGFNPPGMGRAVSTVPASSTGSTLKIADVVPDSALPDVSNGRGRAKGRT